MTALGFCFWMRTFTDSIISSYNIKLFESSKGLNRYLLISNFSTCKRFVTYQEKNPKHHKVFIAGSGVEVKKKVPTTSKIYVININGTKETMYLEQAEKIARHNNYKLLKVDSNLNKELYQFCKGPSFDLDKKNKKDIQTKTKKILIGSEILQNDLQYKVNNILKLLKKGKQVAVLLEGKQNNEKRVESTYNFIIKEVGPDCKIINMSKKSSGIAFTIMPAENKEESDGSSGDADKEDSNVQSNLT